MTGRVTEAAEPGSVPPGGRAAAIRSPNAAELGFLPALSPTPKGDAISEVSLFLRRIAAFLGIDARHLAGPVLDTATNGGTAPGGAAKAGSTVLSPFAADNPLPLVRAVIGGGVCFAGAGITVRAGHRLRIDSPEGLPVTVIAGYVVLEAGAALETGVSTRIIADRFEGAGTAPNILVVGQDGGDGPRGPDGRGTSAPGAPGGDGGRGAIAATQEFTFQEVKGRFLAETRRGNGGTGGEGGNGAIGGRIMRGGDGGPGGNGGDTSNGCRIVVRYGVLAQDAAFSLVSEPVRPGAGGDGGKGGFGGVEGFGSDGSRGRDGGAGTPSSLETIPIG